MGYDKSKNRTPHTSQSAYKIKHTIIAIHTMSTSPKSKLRQPSNLRLDLQLVAHAGCTPPASPRSPPQHDVHQLRRSLSKSPSKRMSPSLRRQHSLGTEYMPPSSLAKPISVRGSSPRFKAQGSPKQPSTEPTPTSRRGQHRRQPSNLSYQTVDDDDDTQNGLSSNLSAPMSERNVIFYY